MPDFRKIHQFVAFVDKCNTKDNEEDDATLNNLADRNYHIIKAIKEDNALRKFKDKYKYDSVKVAEIYGAAKELGFLERVDSTVEPHVVGICVLVTFKGKEFIHQTRRLKLKTGKWSAWVEHHNQKLVIAAALIGGGALGNIDYIIKFFQWVF